MPPKEQVEAYYMNEKTGESYNLEEYLNAKYEAERQDQTSVTLTITAAVFIVSSFLFLAMSILSLEEIYRTAFSLIGVVFMYGLFEVGLAARQRIAHSKASHIDAEPVES